MKKEELIGLLRATITAVEQNDSFEGRIQFQATASPDEFIVNAFVRTGNAMGQGGAMISNERLRE